MIARASSADFARKTMIAKESSVVTVVRPPNITTPFFSRSIEYIQCCAASALSASVAPSLSMAGRAGKSVYMKTLLGGLDGSATNIQKTPQNAEIVRQMMERE